jgi:hypothetical protein
VWARAAETEVAGAPALALSPEDLLVHLCVHVAHDHAFDVKLLHLYDLAAVAERFGARLDWERVAAAAGEAGVASYVYCALRVADSLFGLDGSARAGVEAVPHGPADDAATSLVRAYVVAEPPDVGEAYRRVHGEHTLLGAARALARAIVPPAHDLRLARGLPLDRPVGAREYLDHAWTRLRRRGGDVVEMVLGSPRMRAAREHARARRAIGRWVVSRAAPAVPAPLASPASPPPVRRARTR